MNPVGIEVILLPYKILKEKNPTHNLLSLVNINNGCINLSYEFLKLYFKDDDQNPLFISFRYASDLIKAIERETQLELDNQQRVLIDSPLTVAELGGSSSPYGPID